MPLIKMKKVWDYCTYNKLFFLFVLSLLAIMTYITPYQEYYDNTGILLLIIFINILTFGYGTSITRDRIIMGKDCQK